MGPEAMGRLGAAAGDAVLIVGPRSGSSCAAAWPADEDGRGGDTIRIDGPTRRSAGAAVNDAVEVSRVDPRPASSALLSREGGGAAAVDGEFAEFVKGRLKGVPVTEGDEISVTVLGDPMDFRVGATVPGGVVEIVAATGLEIRDPEDARPGAAGGGRGATYEEVGGLGAEIRAMREIVELPLRHPELFGRLGVEPHSGILLYGPPGCGKTLIARVLAGESGASMHLISGPEIMNKYYGETEARLRGIFKEAKDNSPGIIFIDEIDAIAPKREEAHGDVEKRVVAQLLSLMDGLTDRGNVVVLGATNRPGSVDPALRRPGRFDREVEISVPNEDGRLEVLQIHTRGMPVAGDADLAGLAAELHGYTGADIKSLCREAAMKAVRRYLPEIDLETDRIPAGVLRSMEVRLGDFREAMHEVVPTAMREFYVERPKVWWSGVGGLDGAKEALRDSLMAAVRDPSRFARMGVRAPRGALIYGPPGCGKSLLARALASESGASVMLVRGHEILSKWVGESEKAVREVFRKAKAASPCVVVFDELDSLAGPREAGGPGGGSGGGAVLGQLLTEMDDSAPSSVCVVGVTSRPDLLDGSLLRAGRLDLAVYAGPPDEAGRLEIAGILAAGMPLADDVRLGEVAARTGGFTGADLSALCREAAICAMRRDDEKVGAADFEAALGRIRPSVTEEARRWYDAARDGMGAVPKSLDSRFYG